MSHADHVQNEIIYAGAAGAAGPLRCKAGKSRAAANMAAADAFAASFKTVLPELLLSKSKCKRLTPARSSKQEKADNDIVNVKDWFHPWDPNDRSDLKYIG